MMLDDWLTHRWSGWPGAWCLDCGTSDPYEECVSVCGELDGEILYCDRHPVFPCTKKGQKLFDPYTGNVEEGHPV